MDFSRPAPVFSACLLFELSSSHFIGFGACFFVIGVWEMGRNTWYGFDIGS